MYKRCNEYNYMCVSVYVHTYTKERIREIENKNLQGKIHNPIIENILSLDPAFHGGKEYFYPFKDLHF